jgi:hypothetical protein
MRNIAGAIVINNKRIKAGDICSQWIPFRFFRFLGKAGSDCLRASFTLLVADATSSSFTLLFISYLPFIVDLYNLLIDIYFGTL